MNKPKARYDQRRGVWIVWDGVSFGNGFSHHPYLPIAYNFYLEMQATLNSVRDLDRAYRNLAFWHSQSRETL